MSSILVLATKKNSPRYWGLFVYFPYFCYLMLPFHVLELGNITNKKGVIHMDMNSNIDMGTNSGVEMSMEIKHSCVLNHHYKVECFGADGQLKWVEDFDNLVTTEGLNHYLDATIKTGSASPVWYVGLVDNAGYTAYNAADTAGQINGTNGWDELSEYTEGVRQTYVEGTISGGSVDNSASKAAFSMNATKTVRGAFLINNSTVDGTTGVLLGVGDFSAARDVISGDTLNVTITVSIS